MLDNGMTDKQSNNERQALPYVNAGNCVMAQHTGYNVLHSQ